MNKITDSECAAAILKLVTSISASSGMRLEILEADEEFRKQAEGLWEETHPNDGVVGFSQNPYRKNGQSEIEKARSSFLRDIAITDFVTNKICSLLPEASPNNP